MGLFGGRSRAEKERISSLKRQGFTEFDVKEAVGVPDARQLVGGTLMIRLAPEELPEVVYMLASPQGGPPSKLTARDVVGLHARSRGMSWFGFGASGALAASLASSLDRHLAGWELSVLHSDGLSVRMVTNFGAPPEALLRAAAHRASLAPAHVPTAAQHVATPATPPKSALRRSPLPKDKDEVAAWVAGHAQTLPGSDSDADDLHYLVLAYINHDLDDCNIPVEQHIENGIDPPRCTRGADAEFHITPEGVDLSFQPHIVVGYSGETSLFRSQMRAFDRALQQVDWPGRSEAGDFISYNPPRISYDDLHDVSRRAVETLAHLRIKPNRLWLLKVIWPHDHLQPVRVSVVSEPPQTGDDTTSAQDSPGPHDREQLVRLIAAHAEALPQRPNSYLEIVWAHHSPTNCGVPVPQHCEVDSGCTNPMPSFMITADTGRVRLSPPSAFEGNPALASAGYQALRDLDRAMTELGWTGRNVNDGHVMWSAIDMQDVGFEAVAAMAVDAMAAAGAPTDRIWLVDVTGPSYLEGKASQLATFPN